MVDKQPIFERERENIAFFETLPVNDRARVDFTQVSGVQYLQPLFEFPGACAGCGETPYLRSAEPVVRRSPAGGQRHRLLVDLRRQPAGRRRGR